MSYTVRIHSEKPILCTVVHLHITVTACFYVLDCNYVTGCGHFHFLLLKKTQLSIHIISQSTMMCDISSQCGGCTYGRGGNTVNDF